MNMILTVGSLERPGSAWRMSSFSGHFSTFTELRASKRASGVYKTPIFCFEKAFMLWHRSVLLKKKYWLWIWLMSLIWLMLGLFQDNVYTNYNNFPNILHLLLTSFEDLLLPFVTILIGNKSAGRKYTPWFS